MCYWKDAEENEKLSELLIYKVRYLNFGGGDWYPLQQWFSTGSDYARICGNSMGCHNWRWCATDI